MMATHFFNRRGIWSGTPNELPTAVDFKNHLWPHLKFKSHLRRWLTEVVPPLLASLIGIPKIMNTTRCIQMVTKQSSSLSRQMGSNTTLLRASLCVLQGQNLNYGKISQKVQRNRPAMVPSRFNDPVRPQRASIALASPLLHQTRSVGH